MLISLLPELFFVKRERRKDGGEDGIENELPSSPTITSEPLQMTSSSSALASREQIPSHNSKGANQNSAPVGHHASTYSSHMGSRKHEHFDPLSRWR